jgi:hypothetical protein
VPMAVSDSAECRVRLRTLSRVAPSAMRIAISRVRSATNMPGLERPIDSAVSKEYLH